MSIKEKLKLILFGVLGWFGLMAIWPLTFWWLDLLHRWLRARP